MHFNRTTTVFEYFFFNWPSIGIFFAGMYSSILQDFILVQNGSFWIDGALASVDFFWKLLKMSSPVHWQGKCHKAPSKKDVQVCKEVVGVPQEQTYYESLVREAALICGLGWGGPKNRDICRPSLQLGLFWLSSQFSLPFTLSFSKSWRSRFS